MEIGSGGASALAEPADHLAAGDRVAFAGEIAGVVAVNRDVVIVMANDDDVAVTAKPPRIDHGAAFGGVNRGPDRRRDIHAVVHGAVADSEARRDHAMLDRPSENPRRMLVGVVAFERGVGVTAWNHE